LHKIYGRSEFGPDNLKLYGIVVFHEPDGSQLVLHRGICARVREEEDEEEEKKKHEGDRRG
jgi:hypothetical protein